MEKKAPEGVYVRSNPEFSGYDFLTRPQAKLRDILTMFACHSDAML